MHSRILVPLVALIVAMQASCCCATLGAPKPPYTISPSDDAVDAVKERLAEQHGGSFTLTITDEEATSLAADALAKYQDTAPISDPQVFFRNGRAEAYGTVHLSDSLSLPGMLACSITVNDDGQPVVIIEEMVVGPLPAPASALEVANEEVNRILSENVGDRVTLTDLQIGEGDLTVFGQLSSE